MKSFVAKRYWLALLYIAMIFIIAGCASTVSPTQVDPTTTIESAYPAVNDNGQGQAGSFPAYPVGNELPQTVDPNKILAPKEAPQPDKDKASASGVLYSISGSSVLWNFEFYLTPAQGDKNDEVPPLLLGAFSEKGDILARTDQKGEFQINNIPPGKYYIILVAPGDYLVAVNSLEDTSTPRMVTFNPNEAQPLGLIVFP